MARILYDVSVPLRPEMPLFPGDPAFTRSLACSLAAGGPANTSQLGLCAHAGTHVDAPLHMIAGGADVTSFPPEALVGEAVVIAITDPVSIGRPELQRQEIPRGTRVLFKTRNSTFWREPGFRSDFVYLTREAAEYLNERDVRLVGIDYLSIEKFGSESFPVHLALMERGVVILEGLDLSRIAAGRYELFCGPLSIPGADGAPARVFLAQDR